MFDVLRPVHDASATGPYLRIESLVGRTETPPKFLNEDGAEDFLGAVNGSAKAAEEPFHPARHVHRALLRALQDVVIRVALLPDLRRHAVEPLRTVLGTCESHVGDRARNTAVAVFSADIGELDQLLRRYGPQTDPVRKALQRYTELKLEDLFPTKANGRRDVDSPTSAGVLDDVQDQILALRPGDERQRWLSAQALAASARVSAAQSKMVEENTNTVPLPFVGAVTLWLAVLYASFGLCAPRSSVTVVALFLSAFAVSMACKHVLDLDTPLAGGIHVTRPPIHISSESLRDVLQVIRK